MFKLLVIDIDGVMTDGTKLYDKDANVIGKYFKDIDFTAIKMFRRLGVKVCFLSGDLRINQKMAEDRGVDFWDARLPDGSMNKSVFAERLSKHYDVPINQIAYIGDDLYDIPLFSVKGIFSFCPYDAPIQVRLAVSRVSNRCCGGGVVSDLLEEYLCSTNQKLKKEWFVESGAEVEKKNLEYEQTSLNLGNSK